MKLLVITNRNIQKSGAKDEKLFGEQVNDKGASELRLAWAEKRAGGKWRLDLIVEPERQDLNPENLPSQRAFKRYVSELEKAKQDGVFYVHGYNRSFKESLEQAHEVHKRYKLGVLVFSWPSNPGGFILNEYKKARSIASNSIIALDRTFERLGRFFCENHDEGCEISFNLLLHSLGNFMFEEFVRNPIFAGETCIFDNIALNAADVDLKRHERWADKLKYALHVYAIINERDRILRASDIINPDRLGNTARKLRSKQLQYFDLTDGKGVKKKHRHFESTAKANKTVEGFFKRVLHGEPGFPLPGTTFNSKINAYQLD